MSYGTVQAEKMTTESGYSLGAGNASSFKNRIINGGMVIDQRNAGASVTPTDAQFLVDRWKARQTVASKFSAQQNAGSVTPPSGFTNYLGATSLSSYSVTGTDNFVLFQDIEGFNTSDLAWGTAGAVSVTLSFWVRSSLTGTFGGVIRNYNGTRDYGFTYTISASNTWEQKTITIPGDTSGTWATTNSGSIRLIFSLGVGPSLSGTAGSWGAQGIWGVTGATSVVGTNGATFYITGVQLEVGTVATSFDSRDYGRELMLCQRYFAKSYNQAIALATPGEFAGASGRFVDATSNYASVQVFFPVRMRTTPTVTIYNPSTGATASLRSDSANHPAGVTQQGEAGCWFFANDSTISTSVSCRAHYGASAEL